MDLMKLNELQKETIFMRMLSGGNLKSCRQVCSSWNKYIQELWEKWHQDYYFDDKDTCELSQILENMK